MKLKINLCLILIIILLIYLFTNKTKENFNTPSKKLIIVRIIGNTLPKLILKIKTMKILILY